MPKHKKIKILTYLLGDLFMAMLAWICFFLFRKLYLEPFTIADIDVILSDGRFFMGVIFIPLCWIGFYYIVGTYTDIYRKSRLIELGITLMVTLVGVVVIFFFLILDDRVTGYTSYYESFAVLFLAHFSLTAIWRIILLNQAKRQLAAGMVGYNTLIIGGNNKALELYEEISGRDKDLGYRFIGYVNSNGEGPQALDAYLPQLGDIADLESIISNNRIEEVIIAIETSEHPRLNNIINRLATTNVIIKIIPDMYDILLGTVKMNHVLQAVLIEINPDLMPQWQKILKRGIDVMAASVFMILLTPVYIYAAIRVRLDSPGPVIFVQERVGLHGKPFKMFKFRSMYVDAETKGPALSHSDDSRITPWGRIMRKWRIDELPQFWNVLIGEMSLVGHRPERQYYIDQIVQQAPHYRHVHKVKPGITSWGMVKFGYAENVNQMIERLKYDILYIENMSLALDFKIMAFTIITILQGRGK